MRDFLRALKYVWQFRGRVVAAWLCAIMVAVLWAGTMGAGVPLFTLIFEKEPKGVSYTSSIEDGEEKWTLVASSQYIVKEGPEFKVEGDVVYVPGDAEIVHRGTESPLEPLARSVEEKLPTVGAAVRRVLALLPTDQYGLLVVLMILWIIIGLLHGIFKYLNEYLVDFSTQRALLAIRTRAYERIINVPISFFARRPVSDVMSRFHQDCELVGHGIAMVIGRLFSEPIRAGVCLTLAVIAGVAVDWRMPVIVLVSVPICGLMIRFIAKRMRRATRKALESRASIMGILEETLFGIRVVKGYTMEGYERRRFFRAGRGLWKQVRRAVRLDAATKPILETVFMIAIAVAMIFGGYLIVRVARSEESVRSMIAFFLFLAGASDPIRKLAGISNRIQQAAAASNRVFEIIDAEIEHRKGTRGIVLPRLRESIEFREVNFSYHTAGSAEALKEINLKVPRGQVLAIVGRTGCGKSTLVSLLPRFYEPGSGAVLIDGVDVREATLRSLREQIGLVTQETILFADTLANNIAYGWRARGRGGNRWPSADDIVKAAEAAHADEFIKALPHGYDTMIGEHGARLSGGERQRIALARAILRDPAILILDEATSALDEQTQALVQDALRHFVKGRTTFLIAHRLSTLEIAHRIVVMDAGRIIADGTHQELLESCDLYRRLYETGLTGV